MTVAEVILVTSCLLALVAAISALLPVSLRRVGSGLFSASSAVAAGVSAALVLSDRSDVSAYFPDLMALAGVRVHLDSLGAWFVLITATVAAPAAIFGIGYTKHGLQSRTVQAMFPLFVLSLVLVPLADSVFTLLVFWEFMAITSLVLASSEHRRAETRAAVQWYAVMTHLGLVALALGMWLFASEAVDDSFASLRVVAPLLSDSTSAVVFLLVVAGFGSKAGVVPLHVWLPRAHPEAPSHVSAVMSGAMVKMGVYGVVRVSFDLMSGGPSWWGTAVLAVGMASALFGILHALVSSDLKRLLAYSTTENVGLIFIGVGAGLLFAANGETTLASLALAAALLHAFNHGLFKALLFLGAGSVLFATGTRDLDRLGGLASRMRVTTVTVAIGALSIMALPPLNGFTGEWLLFQSLVHGLPSQSMVLTIVLPLAVGVLALVGGLAAATFVKTFGTGFLALPRSPEATRAKEVSKSMVSAQVVLAAACVVFGIFPAILLGSLERVVERLAVTGELALVSSSGWLRDPAMGMSMSLTIVAMAVVACAGGIVVVLQFTRARHSRRLAENWGCGRTIQTSRMEYTATSYAEPLQRIFDDVLRPEQDLVVDHQKESRYFIGSIRYRTEVADGFERKIYVPILKAFARAGDAARVIQNGSIHRYLAYGLAALTAVLVVAR